MSSSVAAEDVQPTVNQPESPSENHENKSLEKKSTAENEAELQRAVVADNKKKNGGLGAVALIFACGTALFSDGYVNANSGPTNTIINAQKKRDPARYAGVSLTHFSSLFSSLVFAGTILGMVCRMCL
jgi:hypothetical protein